MKRKPLRKPHLVVNDLLLTRGSDWAPRLNGWCMAWVGSGIGYWHGREAKSELQPGSVVAFPAGTHDVFRASLLNDVELSYFSVEPDRLMGILGVREQEFFNQSTGRRNSPARIFAPDSMTARRITETRAIAGQASPVARLQLLQVFLEAFEWKGEAPPTVATASADGRARLRQILDGMAASDFVELSVSDLAPKISCSARHFNRLFREELGSSFREKQIELRLARARELLERSDAKVVEVALESGYQSTSVFSEVFKRHTGVSPGQWRQERLKAASAL